MTRRCRRAIAIVVLGLLVIGADGTYAQRGVPGKIAAPKVALTAEERNVLTADDLLHQAKDAMAHGATDRAKEYLQRIIALPFPRDREGQHLLAGAYLLLAQLQLAQRQSSQAEHSANEALSRCAASPCLIVVKSYRLLARIARAADQPAKAQDLDRKAADLMAKLSRQGH